MKRRQRHGAIAGTGADKRRRRLGRVGLAAIVATSAWGLLAATAASGSTVTVGSVLPLSFSSTTFGQVETFFNTALPERGANLVSPVSGAIVRWRMQGASGGPYYLRVLHPTGTGAYEAAGTSGPATPSGSGLQTFAANLPIHAGDLIGVDPTHTSDGIGIASAPGASFAYIFPPPFDGATVAPSGTGAGQEIELNAEVQPAPAITSINPSSGSVKGGDTVIITGRELTSASMVKFGSTPAASFTVNTDTQITATTPRSSTPGTVDVSATTLAGTSATVRGDRFTYMACVVPQLKGKKLKAIPTVLRNARCKLGKVTGKRGKVIRQSPKAGKVLPPGGKVNVKLAG